MPAADLPSTPALLRTFRRWQVYGAKGGKHLAAIATMMRASRIERQLPLVMVEVLGAVVIAVEHAHGVAEWIPGRREMHDQVQAVVGFDGELAL